MSSRFVDMETPSSKSIPGLRITNNRRSTPDLGHDEFLRKEKRVWRGTILALLVYSKEQRKGRDREKGRGNEYNATDTNETAVKLLRLSVEAVYFFYGESACVVGGKDLKKVGNVRTTTCVRGERFAAGQYRSNVSTSPAERFTVSDVVR